MLGTLDLREVKAPSGDRASLRAHLQMLVGQPFLHLRFSYGDELALHLGPPRDGRARGGVRSVKGSYIVAARASSWLLRTEGPPTVVVGTSPAGPPTGFQSLTTRDVERPALIRPGSLVVLAEPIALDGPGGGGLGFGGSFALSDGSSLLILPDSAETSGEDDEGDEIADWEVFTPYQRYLRVGPGATWAYLPSATADGPSASA